MSNFNKRKGDKGMIKAILMDYTGTILQQTGPEIEKMIYRVTKYSDFASVNEAMKFWFTNLEKYERDCVDEKFLTQDELCLTLLKICQEKYNLKDDIEFLHQLNQGLWKNGPFYDDVVPFFSACKLPIYIITNNGITYAEENFRKNNVNPAGIISAEDVRAYKPHPAIFCCALKKASCNADEVVHIGDSYSADYLGARKCGIRSVLIDRNGKDTHDCKKITDLRDILDLI